jgi:hypothetical protein
MKLTEVLIERALALSPRIKLMANLVTQVSFNIFKLGQSVLEIAKVVDLHSKIIKEQQEVIKTLYVENGILIKNSRANGIDAQLPSITPTPKNTKPN